MQRFIILIICVFAVFTNGSIMPKNLFRQVSKSATVLASAFAGGLVSVSPVLADYVSTPWSDQIKYEVVKSAPNGDVPKIGELVAIRFKGAYKGNVFDDTFATDQPYFYRCGVGSVLKGLDDTVANMHVGDRFKLKFAGEYAFGQKGKPSAPGKPRIPPNAEVDYEVELVELPGKGDDFIADYEE